MDLMDETEKLMNKGFCYLPPPLILQSAMTPAHRRLQQQLRRLTNQPMFYLDPLPTGTPAIYLLQCEYTSRI